MRIYHVNVAGAALQARLGCPLGAMVHGSRRTPGWNSILEINYWPIFSIAHDLVKELPVKAVPPVMNRRSTGRPDVRLMTVNWAAKAGPE